MLPMRWEREGGGGVQVRARGPRSGSKGELHGEAYGVVSLMGLFGIGNEKARGVGEMMVRVGGCGASVVTSSAKRELD